MLVTLESIAGNNVNATTSLKIAEFTGKRHADVLRDIENLVNSGKLDERNFALISYKDSYGRSQKAYVLDETFTTVLLMGFTGDKALDWKLAYTKAFQEMRSALSQPRTELTIGGVFKDFYGVAEVLGLKAEQAAIHANHATRKETGKDVLALMEYKVTTETRTMSLTKALVGTGVSAVAGNKVLANKGYIEKDGNGNWVLTKSGIDIGGKLVSQELGGKMRQSIEWEADSVIKVILGV